jgi:hypothetical protein
MLSFQISTMRVSYSCDQQTSYLAVAFFRSPYTGKLARVEGLTTPSKQSLDDVTIRESW